MSPKREHFKRENFRLPTSIFQGFRGVFCLGDLLIVTLPETNSLHLKMDGWNTSFLLGLGLFSGAMIVSGRVLLLYFHHGFFIFCGG